MIWDKLTEDWGIFYEWQIAESIISTIYEEDPRDGGDYGFLHESVGIEDDWYENTNKNYWKQLCHEIRHENRFSPKSFEPNFFKLIINANEEVVNGNITLVRARIHSESKKIDTHDMGAPPSHQSTFGRMNPKGISYLYLAENTDTCVYEVHPHETDYITIGTFKLKNSLRLVDLTEIYIQSPFKWGQNLSNIYRNKNILLQFIKDISKSVSSNSSYLDYLPTQFISEFIKQQGFDGIIFNSSSGLGSNYVLFNPNNATCSKTTLIKNIASEYKYDTE